MGTRALSELLLRPRTLVHTPARFTPAWTAARHIASTPSASAQQPARQENPTTATTPEVAAASPAAPSSSDAANRAVDGFFASPASNSTGNTAAAAAASFAAAAPGIDTPRPFGAEFSRPNARGRSRPIGLQFEDMAMPEGLAHPSLANKPSSAASLAAAQAAALESYPRLTPTYGRSVELDSARGRDIVRGIGMLGSLMARNKIKADFNKQRFHERPGLKRKRLNSERWRARFRKGFQQVTGRVVELTKKGW